MVVDAGVWYHIAFTFNAGTVDFYLDGAKIATKSLGITSLYNSTAPLLLGQSGGDVNVIDGLMDEVRLSQTIRWSGNFTPETSAYTAD